MPPPSRLLSRETIKIKRNGGLNLSQLYLQDIFILLRPKNAAFFQLGILKFVNAILKCPRCYRVASYDADLAPILKVNEAPA
jgi:hypothetical protein